MLLSTKLTIKIIGAIVSCLELNEHDYEDKDRKRVSKRHYDWLFIVDLLCSTILVFMFQWGGSEYREALN